MRAYLKLIAILLLPLAFVIWYANSPVQLPPPGWKLSKAHNSLTQTLSTGEGDSLSPTLSKVEGDISVPFPPPSEGTGEAVPLPDTTAHRILFFGDSMVEGLLRRMNCYAYANGYQMTNVVWYSSTTELWAETDTLRYFMNKANPSFIMISLGMNEQFIKNPASHEPYIRKIMQVVDDIPFVWIGVPAWKEDTGINELTKRVVGESRYFDSRGLTLQRGRDRMHPTFNSASRWMDTVAVWMASPATAHPIRMNKPTDGKKHTYRTYALQPMRTP